MKKIMMLTVLGFLLIGCTHTNKNALSLEEAQEIALQEVSGNVVKAKADRDDGIDYYDFTIITDNEKYEIEIDANSGKIIKIEKDDDYEGLNTNTESQTNQTTENANYNDAKITANEAQQKAMDRVGGGNLVKCELDYDDGILKYEIEIKNGNQEYDVDIDANTGEIIKFKEEYDD